MLRLHRLTCKWFRFREYSSKSQRIGFIGLGVMGSKLAEKMIIHGTKVVGYDIDPKKREFMKKKGCLIAESPKELAKQTDIVFSLLPNYSALSDACDGNDGILSGARTDLLLVDLSTIGPVNTVLFADIVSSKVQFLSAPIAGSTQSIDEDILFLVGGSKELVSKVDPYFQQMAEGTEKASARKCVIHIGSDITDGQAARMCGVLLLACTVVATAEVMNLGIRLGLNPTILKDALSLTSARCWACQFYNPVPNVIKDSPASLQYQPGQSILNFMRGLAVAQDLAIKVHSPIPLASIATQMFNIAAVRGFNNKDMTAVYKLYKQSLIAED